MDTTEVYVDPWQEYRAISAKLKKRFLRKPNLAEASRSFERLSRRLEYEEQNYNYAGFCKLGVARCEHSLGNVTGESGGLVSAGQLFVKAEREKADLALPSFEDNLNVAIHCFGHAIRVHTEHNELELAASLCIELGICLVVFDKHSEALGYFEKALNHLNLYPLGKIYATKWVILRHLRLSQFTTALDVVDTLDTLTQSILYNQPPTGFYRKLLRDTEIIYLLLCLRLNLIQPDGTCSKHIKSDRWQFALENITIPSACPSRRVTETRATAGAPPQGDTASPRPPSLVTFRTAPLPTPAKDLASQSRLHPYMSEDLFLYLQSFVMAILQDCWEDADELIGTMWPELDAIQRDLATDLVLTLMNNPGNDA